MSNVNNAIKRLARQCANFTEGGRCLLEPNGQPYCNFFRTDAQARPFVEDGTIRCGYFEKSVLPANPAIEAKYWNRTPSPNAAKCVECGTSYERRSNRQKYCDGCRGRKETEARRKRDAKYRQKVRDKTTV